MGKRDSRARPKYWPPVLSTAASAGSWAAAGPARTKESVLQIVAHPDDDLFFINPEVGQSLRSGRPLASVYLTSGESNGVNGPDPGVHSGLCRPVPDKAKYAKARQNGIRAAYAEMVTGDAVHPWRRTVIATAGGGLAELDTLQGHPHIHLVWTLLHEAGSITGDRPQSLHALWDGRTRSIRSQLAYGGLVIRDFSYSAEQLIQTLVGYLRLFRPTHVRMQDPTPGRLDRNHKYADHQDHLYGARFVQRALARYASACERPHFTVQTYLGYFNGGLPGTLDPASGESKARTMETYSWSGAPRNSCQDPAGCGDKNVAAHPKRHWSHSIHHARDTGTCWLQTGKDDSLWAFAVLSGRIVFWHRPAGGTGLLSEGQWRGPTFLPGIGIDAGVRPITLPDGRIAVLGTRTLTGKQPGDYRREVGFTVQRESDHSFEPWHSLGTPESCDHAGTSDISAPAVSVDADHTMTVFLRDSRHQLTARTRLAGGSWTPWRHLGGEEVHGDPVVGRDSMGRTYVLASTPHSVLAWVRDQPGTSAHGPLPTGLPPTTLPLTVRRDGDGIRVYFRKPRSGNVRTARLRAADLVSARSHTSRWPSNESSPVEVADLGGPQGYGPVSVNRTCWGDFLLAARSATGDLATAWSPSATPKRRLRWRHTGFLLAGAPSSTQLASGGAALTVLGLDGRLYWTHTTDKGPFLAPWQPAVPGQLPPGWKGDVNAQPRSSR
ncbi:PIG-L family deacetylase [Streptomyces chattanoogensis]|uniref:PIG-L family deacetylase n=1 Tax=Streptomyces chattanoogensis TaxID=66876 RepID=UPI0012FF0D6E|nr:PIG-L family deacetylase [Streptomyces chattanoogensis]